MTTITTNDTAARLDRLERVVRDLLAEARRQGATAAEAAASSEAGLEINVRLGEVETVEHTRDNGLGITVYFGQRKGSASTSDLSPEAVRDAVTAACAIASRTQEDPHAGLADAELMAQDLPELDLHHPWDLEPDAAPRTRRRSVSESSPPSTASIRSSGGSICPLAIASKNRWLMTGFQTCRCAIARP